MNGIPPISKKVADYLMGKIACGEMKLGEAIYSENKLCKILNVSRTSVRRAIREMVNNNILESRQGAGTFVSGLTPPSTICLINHHTRSLRQTQADSYYTDIIYNAERRVTENNCRFQIFSGVLTDSGDIAKKTAILNANAVIVDGNFQDYFDDVACFRQVFSRCVILDGNPSETNVASVSIDLVPGFTEILQKATSRNGGILFLYNGAIARRRWAKDCFVKASHAMNFNNYELCDYTQNISQDLLSVIDHGYLIAPRLDKLLSEKRISSIICGSDRTALQVVAYLNSNHYNVPGDIAVSGVGGIDFSRFCNSPLTTIKIHSGLMAMTAVDLLLKMLHGHSVPQLTLLPAQFLDRDSLC